MFKLLQGSNLWNPWWFINNRASQCSTIPWNFSQNINPNYLLSTNSPQYLANRSRKLMWKIRDSKYSMQLLHRALQTWEILYAVWYWIEWGHFQPHWIDSYDSIYHESCQLHCSQNPFHIPLYFPHSPLLIPIARHYITRDYS